MAIKSSSVAILMIIGALVFCACKKDGGKNGSGEAVSKTTVTFASGRSATGTLKQFSIKQSDQVALVHASSSEKAVAGPLSAGDNTSVYMFNLKNPAKGDVLVGYYPAAENITVNGASVVFDFPSSQDGTDSFQAKYIGSARNTGSAYLGNSITLSPMAGVVIARVQKGAYSVVKAEMKANGGEMLSGNMKLDYSSMRCSGGSGNVTVTLPSPLDCRTEAQSLSFFVPPVTLSKGFTILYTMSDGTSVSYNDTKAVDIGPGALVDTDPASGGRTLIACGSNKVYMFDEKLASSAGNYSAALTWSWDATTAAAIVGLGASRMDHIDDAKPVMDGKKLLITSSYNWALLLNIETKKVEWSTTGVTNAHSAEILPRNRVAVAAADGFVAIYDLSSSAQIAQYTLSSAHGVVWSEKRQRLYAVGATSLQIYKLKNWDTSSPELELERTVSTSGFVTGLHDMTMVDEDTLIMGGNKAAFYNMNTGAFTQLAHFNTCQGVKSLNYNPSTGEIYYTYAWEGHSEGGYTWSSHKVRYTDDVYANDNLVDKKVIEVGDISMYKVRVMAW